MQTPMRRTVAFATVGAMAALVLVGLSSNMAWAGSSVTIPTGNPHDQQVITVTGAGFPDHAKIPTGMQILECADPDGTQANLPTSNLLCDGSTINPSQINTDAHGSFAAKYTVYALNGAHTSNIYCDKTHYCVLWVGVDYNQDFFGIHAFSRPFQVGASATAGVPSSGSGIGIWIPIVVVIVVVGGVLLVTRARRRQPAPSSSA